MLFQGWEFFDRVERRRAINQCIHIQEKPNIEPSINNPLILKKKLSVSTPQTGENIIIWRDN